MNLASASHGGGWRMWMWLFMEKYRTSLERARWDDGRHFEARFLFCLWNIALRDLVNLARALPSPRISPPHPPPPGSFALAHPGRKWHQQVQTEICRRTSCLGCPGPVSSSSSFFKCIFCFRRMPLTSAPHSDALWGMQENVTQARQTRRTRGRVSRLLLWCRHSHPCKFRHGATVLPPVWAAVTQRA